jgi:hypothetical protein
MRIPILIVAFGCNSSTPQQREPQHRAWGSTVSAPGDRVRGDVLALDAKRAVIAETAIADGRYELAAPPNATSIVVRFEAPFIGVREVPVAGGAAPAVAIAAGDVAHLHGAIVGPAFDWIELGVTPTDVPPTVALWADASGGLRASMSTAKLTTPAVDVAVLRGRYRIVLDRVVDGPKGSTGATLGLDHVEVGATKVPVELGGATLAVDGAVDATFVVRATP